MNSQMDHEGFFISSKELLYFLAWFLLWYGLWLSVSRIFSLHWSTISRVLAIALFSWNARAIEHESFQGFFDSLDYRASENRLIMRCLALQDTYSLTESFLK